MYPAQKVTNRKRVSERKVYRIVNNVLFNLKKTFKLSNLNLLGDIMVALSSGLRTLSFQRSPTGKLLYFPEIPGFTHC